MSSESPLVVLAQAVVAIAVIAAATVLAYLDPASRPVLEGAFVLAVGSAVTWFFSARSQANGAALAIRGTEAAGGAPGAATGSRDSASPGPGPPVA
jgi:hypothetical protein